MEGDIEYNVIKKERGKETRRIKSEKGNGKEA